MTTDRWNDDMEAVADSLDEIAERLAELGLTVLRAALDENGPSGSRPEADRRIVKARRSVERAAALLRGGPSSTVI